jgi:hypothetical protein
VIRRYRLPGGHGSVAFAVRWLCSLSRLQCHGWERLFHAYGSTGRPRGITIHGDGHYGRPEIMEWCDEDGVDFIFGLPGNVVLDRLVDDTADDIRTRRALDQKPCLRGFCRDGLSGEILEDRPACLCPDRGHRQGPRHPPARAPQTRASGESDASVAHALVAPVCRSACHPAPS